MCQFNAKLLVFASMRLRYALISLFLALTAVPLTVFWAWPHSQVMQGELDDVRDRHLLLARNLGAALQRYHQDVLATFNMISVNLIEQRRIEQAQDALINLSFRHVCIADEKTRVVTGEVSPFSRVDLWRAQPEGPVGSPWISPWPSIRLP